jgi:hypothetical protein
MSIGPIIYTVVIVTISCPLRHLCLLQGPFPVFSNPVRPSFAKRCNYMLDGVCMAAYTPKFCTCGNETLAMYPVNRDTAAKPKDSSAAEENPQESSATESSAGVGDNAPEASQGNGPISNES